jgi:hypothetical protein
MGAAPGEENAVFGSELDERHRVVETGRETILGRKAIFGTLSRLPIRGP